MKLSEITFINISRYLYPFPPNQHTLNWSFWTHVASQVKQVILISSIKGNSLQTHEEKNILFVGIPDNGSDIITIPRYLMKAYKLGNEILANSKSAIMWASDDIWGNVVATQLARKFCIPYLLELQGNVFSPPSETASLIQRFVQSIAVARGVKAASMVRVCCDDHRKRMVKFGRYKGVSVVPTRVDTRLFDPAKYARHEIRQSFDINPDETIFITVSSLTQRKGIHIFLNAFNKIIQLAPSARYWIVGDGTYRSELESQASAISGNVKFFGRLAHVEIAKLLAASDVFVLPSFGEGMPRSIQEAQAMGLPVIATNVDGIPEQVIDNITGILVQPGDSEALCRAALIMNDASTRIKMGQAGRKHIVLNFDQDAIFARWTKLLLCLADEVRD